MFINREKRQIELRMKKVSMKDIREKVSEMNRFNEKKDKILFELHDLLADLDRMISDHQQTMK
ncbi:hypothetical protein GJU40_13785 [Bacillus lacus]|uniref:Uncharacterized protein n=1 Tax=Metabacillus lacus TaxID=1983721 RepID=A0A7X2J0K2_9BACI|nr:hypothetical protein [Metabacillus lacus]MRX73215.1 hypothetical protein [Metabacillus lacus]